MTEPIHSENQFKILVKNSSWYFIASLLTKASALLLMPIMTRFLSPDDYGVIANLQALITFSSVFVSLYIDSAFNRFYFDNNRSHEELRIYISSFFWFVVLWGSFVTFILLIIGKVYLTQLYSIRFFPLAFLTVISPLFIQIHLFGHHHLRNNLETKKIAIPSVLIFVLDAGISLFLMSYLENNIHGRFYGIFLSKLVTCMYYTFFLVKDGLIILQLDRKIIWNALKFSLPLVPLATSSWVTRLSDRIIITYYTDVAEAGLYDVAYKLSEGIRIFTESIFQVYSPVMISMYTCNKREFNIKVGKFATYFIWITFFVAFYVSIFSKELLTIFTAPAYHSAYILIPIVVFAYFISAQQKYLGAVFSLRKVTYLSTIGYFIQASLNLGFSLVFIPIAGKLAAAWVTFVSLTFLTIWCSFWFLKWEKVQFEWNKIIKIFVIGLLDFISYLLVSHLFSYGTVAMILIKVLATVPLAIGLSLIWNIIRFDQIRTVFSK
jgi:O-antigen/teichoic acid export membrane protein